MTSAHVQVHVDQTSAEIAIQGEIDLDNAAEVRRQLLGSISNQVRTVVVDLTGVTYLDSTGVRILSALAQRLRLLQIHLELVAPVGSPVRRIVELSGLLPLTDLRPRR